MSVGTGVTVLNIDDVTMTPDYSLPLALTSLSHGVTHLVFTSLTLGLIILVTIVGNVFVIAAIILERNLHHVGNYLISSLAVADLMVAALVMPLAAVNEVSTHWFLGSVACDAWVSFDVLCCTSSILHLVAISLDRYWAVNRADYIHNRSARRICAMIALSWGVSAIISIPPLFWKTAPQSEPRNDLYKNVQNDSLTQSPIVMSSSSGSMEECIISQDWGYTVFSTLGAFYIPLIFMMIIYLSVYRTARSRIRKKQFTKGPKSNVFTVTSRVDGDSSVRNCTDEHVTSVCDQLPNDADGQRMSVPSRDQNEVVRPTSLVVSPATALPAAVSSSRSASPSPTASSYPSPSPLPKRRHSSKTGFRFSTLIRGTPMSPVSLLTPISPQRREEQFPAVEREKDVDNGQYAEKNQTFLLAATTPRSKRATAPTTPNSLNAEAANPSNLRGSWLDITRQRWDQRKTTTTTPETDCTAPVCSSTGKTVDKKAKEKREQRRERKAARTLAIITGSFITCWLPFFTVALIRPFCADRCQYPPLLTSVIGWLGYFNSLLNPIIYTVFNPDFRRAFQRILFGKYRHHAGQKNQPRGPLQQQR